MYQIFGRSLRHHNGIPGHQRWRHFWKAQIYSTISGCNAIAIWLLSSDQIIENVEGRALYFIKSSKWSSLSNWNFSILIALNCYFEFESPFFPKPSQNNQQKIHTYSNSKQTWNLKIEYFKGNCLSKKSTTLKYFSSYLFLLTFDSIPI